MEGLYITVGILIATIALAALAAAKSKLRRYRLVSPLRKIEPKKRKTTAKKKKHKVLRVKWE